MKQNGTIEVKKSVKNTSKVGYNKDKLEAYSLY
jgi:hypothetical protein